MFDEKLLARLDATPEVREKGRSAVLRDAVETFLRQHRRASITARYRQAYRKKKGLGKDFSGWEAQGTWPDD